MNVTKENYDKIMETLIKNIEGRSKKPTLLLHSCCAPCSTAVIEFLQKYFEITIFFYNPNITENAEYYLRKKEHLDYLTKEFPNIKLIEGEYNTKEDFFKLVAGFELEKEGGERCTLCYEKRLERTAQEAKNKNFDYFTSVLSISPLKNVNKINEIGRKLENIYSISFLYSDFKKKGRYQRGIELSKKNNLYRQDYCGCIFSKIENEERRKAKMELKYEKE